MYNQAIINGNFDIWQRNTSFTNPSNEDYTVDRWKVVRADASGTAPNVNVERSTTNLPANGKSKYNVKLSPTSTGSTGVGMKWFFRQMVEDYEIFQGKTVSASVTMTIPNGAKMYLQIWDYNSESFSLQQTGTGSEQTVILTHTVHALAGALAVGVILAYDTQFVATVGDYYFSQVQLNVGEVVLPFQPKTFEEELLKCQRYYSKSFPYDNFPGGGADYSGQCELTGSSPNDTVPSMEYPVQMRTTPTVTVYSPATGTSGAIRNYESSSDITSVLVDGTGGDRFRVYKGSAIVDSVLYGVQWTADAEM